MIYEKRFGCKNLRNTEVRDTNKLRENGKNRVILYVRVKSEASGNKVESRTLALNEIRHNISEFHKMFMAMCWSF